ncbi:hypothetical protein [Paraburkholderia fynbosensis]|uniref:Uncharacterized protein n=1 Tax=Paraburkholderia fynbosensis TaxID=1200993 RepID=A0A6J5FR33_9BURK|nr:hypothetical protein [Paraburkholderia fynbosensis]CAB3785538.1 hypothetical protein LMG27177_01866 [Paraburkholderia fynbosensis]
MFTFIVVVAIAAFIPDGAAPAVSLDEVPQAPATGSDAAVRPMPRQRDSGSAG